MTVAELMQPIQHLKRPPPRLLADPKRLQVIQRLVDKPLDDSVSVRVVDDGIIQRQCSHHVFIAAIM